MTKAVTGFAELDRAFAELPKKWQNKGIKPAMKAGMQNIVLRDAQRIVPVRSGMLKKALKVRTAKGPKNKRLPRGVTGFQVESVKTKRVDAYYAPWVFLGAKSRDGVKRPGSRTLRRALYSNAKALRAYIVGQLRVTLPGVIREAAKGTK